MEVTYSVDCCLGTGRNFLFAGATAPLEACNRPLAINTAPPAPPAVLQLPATSGRRLASSPSPEPNPRYKDRL